MSSPSSSETSCHLQGLSWGLPNKIGTSHKGSWLLPHLLRQVAIFEDVIEGCQMRLNVTWRHIPSPSSFRQVAFFKDFLEGCPTRLEHHTKATDFFLIFWDKWPSSRTFWGLTNKIGTSHKRRCLFPHLLRQVAIFKDFLEGCPTRLECHIKADAFSLIFWDNWPSSKTFLKVDHRDRSFTRRQDDFFFIF